MLDRLKAFSVHLACSATVAGILAYLVFGIWYPGQLDKAVGVEHLYLVILVVDASLGPLITFVVYRKGKKYLKLDLAIIVFLQLAALGYGVHTVAEGRPAWIVFNVDRFDVVRAGEVSDTYRAKAAPEYQGLSWLGPRWVAAALPEDSQAKDELLFTALSGGPGLVQRPTLYQPLDSANETMASKAKPLAKLTQFNPKPRVRAVTAEWPKASQWLPLSARNLPLVVLLDGQGQVVAVVDLRPWD